MTKLRVAVIGVGHLGKEHARILATLPDVELVGVVDANPQQAQAIAQKHNTQAYAECWPLYGRIDAASIVVPTTHHLAVAEEFIRRGVHLLIEKPLARSLDEADRLVEMSQAHRVIVQVGHIERFNPAFEEVLRGPIHPKLIRSQRVGPFSGRSSDIGVVLDLMIHDLDLLLTLVPSPVVDVDAVGIGVFGGHEDIVSARLCFANGCVAELLANRASPEPARRMQIWGHEGHADVDFSQRRVTLIQPTEAVRREGLNPSKLAAADRATLREDLFTKYLPTKTIDGQAKDQLTAELDDFVTSVRTGCSPRVTIQAGRDAVALAERILRATRQHRHDAADHPSGPHRLPFPTGPLYPVEDERQVA